MPTVPTGHASDMMVHDIAQFSQHPSKLKKHGYESGKTLLRIAVAADAGAHHGPIGSIGRSMLRQIGITTDTRNSCKIWQQFTWSISLSWITLDR